MEVVFATIRPYLADRFDVEVAVSSFPSSGLLPRLRAVREARARRGEVNHVVGDVHYLDLLLPRRRTVLTIHDTEFLTRATRLKAAIYALCWLRIPAYRAAVITVPSEATRRDLLRVVRIPPRRLRVIRNPVGDQFVPGPRRTARSRSQVLLLGAWPNKNLDRSIEALRGLDVDVALIGRPDERQLRALTDLHASVREGLSDAEVVEAYHAADVLLFPSTSEGFGVPIVEAQACGTPVVTSDREPMSSIAGGGACLVDPTDTAAIRAGLLRVLGDGDYRGELIRAGLHNARRFRASGVADEYAAVYTELLSAR
jgi:glycosyltransferase involved in cell wall biosynthesis